MIDDAQKNKMLRYRWYIFIILIVAYFFVYFHRVAPSVIGKSMMASLELPVSMLALLSSVYFYTYLAMQIPSGVLSDKVGPRMSSGLFLILAAGGALITSASDTFAMMVVGKIMIACGLALVYIPMMKILAVWFRRNEFAPLVGITIAVGNVGALGAAAPLAFLMDFIGWREVFLLLGVVTLILGFLCILIIRNHPSDLGFPSMEEIEYEETGIVRDSSSEKVPIFHGLKTVFAGGMKFWMPTLAYFIVYGTIMVYQGLWVVIYFENTYAFAISMAWMATMIALGKILSTVVLGMAVKRYGLSKKKLMVAGNIGFLITWGMIWLFAGAGNMTSWLTVNFMFGFFGGFMTLSFTQVKEWFPTAVSGTVIAGMNIFLFGGAAIMQSLTYFIIRDKLTSEFELLWMLMFISVAVACVLIAFSVEKDKGKIRENVEKVV